MKKFLKKVFPFQGKAAKTLGAFSGAAMLNDTGEEMFAPFLPLFATVFLGMSPEQYGIMEGMVEAVNRVLRTFTGALSDRWSRKLPVVLGYVLISFSRILMAFVHTWYWLVGARAVRQVGRSMRDPAREAAIADNIDQELRGKAFGFLNAVDTFGAVLGPAVGLGILSLVSFGFLSFNPGRQFSEHAFRWLFVLAAIPTFISALIIMKFLPEKNQGKPESADDKTADKENLDLKSEENQGFWAGIKSYMTHKEIKKMTASNVMLAMGAVPISMMLLYVYKHFSASAAAGGILFIVYSIAHFLTSYPAGDVADRIGGKKTQILAVFFLIAAFASLMVAPSDFWCFPAFIFYACFDSLWLVNRRAIMCRYAPEDRRGQFLGTFSTFYGLSSFLAPILVGIIWQRIGAYHAFGFACIIAAFSLFFMPSDEGGNKQCSA